MNIVAVLRIVPATSCQRQIRAQHGTLTPWVPGSILDRASARALEVAMDYKREYGAKVTVVALDVGARELDWICYTALVGGADRAVKLVASWARTSGSAQAEAIARFVKRDPALRADTTVVLCGYCANHAPEAEVGSHLARVLAVPYMAAVSRIALADDKGTLLASSELSRGGWARLAVPLPAVLGVSPHRPSPSPLKSPPLLERAPEAVEIETVEVRPSTRAPA